MQGEGDWTSAEGKRIRLISAPEVPLTNRYEALGIEKIWTVVQNQKGTTTSRWFSQGPKSEPVPPKKVRVLVTGDSVHRGALRHPSAVQIISLERFAACQRHAF